MPRLSLSVLAGDASGGDPTQCARSGTGAVGTGAVGAGAVGAAGGDGAGAHAACALCPHTASYALTPPSARTTGTIRHHRPPPPSCHTTTPSHPR
eukprot:295969-Prymnesium_polylepis.4